MFKQLARSLMFVASVYTVPPAIADNGGPVLTYALRAAEARESGKAFVIPSPCMSACTLYLSIPKACIRPGTYFVFHAAYGASPGANRFATQYLMASYPPGVQDWIKARGGLSKRLLTMPYKVARKYVRTCSGK